MTEESRFDCRQGQELLLFPTASEQTDQKCFGKSKFHVSDCQSPCSFIPGASRRALRHSALANGDSAIFSCQKAFVRKSRTLIWTADRGLEHGLFTHEWGRQIIMTMVHTNQRQACMAADFRFVFPESIRFESWLACRKF
jgi:hypothetical protein